METPSKKRQFFIFYFSFLIALLCSAPQTSAANRAGEVLEKLAAGFRAMPSYEVAFSVSATDLNTPGRYAVKGEEYYLTLGDAEVFCDGKIRWEVDNRRREVTITEVDASSRNILNNPAHAFDFLGTEYTPELISEADGSAVVRLTPTGKNNGAGVITVTVYTSTMRPRSLSYDYDGEQIRVAVQSVVPMGKPIPAFEKSRYASYEFIDFR